MTTPDSIGGSDLIKHFDRNGDFIVGEDGCCVFWPSNPGGGAFNAWHLRAIADELDRRNADWFRQMDAFFAPETSK